MRKTRADSWLEKLLIHQGYVRELSRGIRTQELPRKFAETIGAEFTETETPGVVSIRTEEVWKVIPHPANDAWSVAFRLISNGGVQPVIGEVRIFPTEKKKPWRDLAPLGQWSAELLGSNAKAPFGGLTARIVRQVRVGDVAQSIGELATSVQNMCRLGEARGGPPKGGSINDSLTMLSGIFPEGGIAQRRGKNDLFYAELARDYTRLFNAGETHPNSVIAKQRKTKRSKVRDMIREARKRKLLSTFAWGRSGGQLTPYALALLEQQTPKPNKKGNQGGRIRPRKNQS